VATAGVGLVAELVGTRTGVPFGEYAYAPGRLGPTVAEVPLVVAAAWTVGAWPAWCAARAVATSPAARAGLTALGLTAWDLYLDPQMLADGRWAFTGGGPVLPGVPALPLTNLLGWALVGLVVGTLLSRVDRDGPARAGDGVPVALYLWTWLGSGLAHLVFLGLPVSGVYGLLGMALLGVPLLRAVRPRRGAVQPDRQGAV
jgi:putative membrane protein